MINTRGPNSKTVAPQRAESSDRRIWVKQITCGNRPIRGRLKTMIQCVKTIHLANLQLVCVLKIVTIGFVPVLSIWWGPSNVKGTIRFENALRRRWWGKSYTSKQETYYESENVVCKVIKTCSAHLRYVQTMLVNS